MKKIILSSVLLVSFCAISFAQAKQPGNTTQFTAQPAPPPLPPGMPSPQEMAQQRAKAVQEQYKLNNEQYNGVFKAELDFFTQERQLRTSGQMGNSQIQKLTMERDQKYQQVMTKEQFAKYDATRPKMPPANMPAPSNQQAAH